MKIVPDAQSDYTGVFTFGSLAEQTTAFNTSSGQNASIVHTHVDWMSNGALQSFSAVDPLMGTSVTELAKSLAAQNSVLAVSWDPMGLDFLSPDLLTGGERPAIGLTDLLNGSLDSYIRQVAQDVASLDVPIMLSLFGEVDSNGLFAYGPNGDQYKGEVTDLTGQYGDPALLDGPERMRDAFKHVIDIFRAEGADNATWFMYMANEVLMKSDSLSPELFYPGDAYIDWVGQSLYLKTADELASNFDTGYNAWGAITDKPFFIPEMGLETAGGAEISALLSALQGYERVGAHTWADWDGVKEQWNVSRLGEGTDEWAAFQSATGLADQATVVVNGQPVDLSTWYAGSGLSEAARTFTGTDSADQIIGTDGDDTLSGLSGDDFYVVDTSNDVILESANGGFDTVMSLTDYTLGGNLEVLLLEGSAVSGTGNDLDNTLTGNAAGNTLYGLEGNDILNGAGGGDTLVGGNGNDTYFTSASNDVVVESAGGGEDTIITTFSFMLPDHVEILAIDGNANNIGMGNNGDNVLLGSNGNNRLIGRDGDDTLQGRDGNDSLFGGNGNDGLEGGEGNDTLAGEAGTDTLSGGGGDDLLILSQGADFAEGGAGADTFEFRATGAMAVIGDFTAGVDVLDLKAMGFASRAEVDAAAYDAGGAGMLLSMGSDSLFLSGVSMSEFDNSLILI